MSQLSQEECFKSLMEHKILLSEDENHYKINPKFLDNWLNFSKEHRMVSIALTQAVVDWVPGPH